MLVVETEDMESCDARGRLPGSLLLEAMAKAQAQGSRGRTGGGLRNDRVAGSRRGLQLCRVRVGHGSAIVDNSSLVSSGCGAKTEDVGVD
jgi:hypothetical protein